VARELGMSARTLSRRLAEEGTTFARIVEEYRASMAKGLLQESDLQVTEIAFVLGYSELSTFSTAFRRWTGKTPLEFRNDGSR
jgi:AraC-like DNA-binding protein